MTARSRHAQSHHGQGACAGQQARLKQSWVWPLMLVFLGGSTGTLVRDLATTWTDSLWAVFVVNVCGALLLGFAGARLARLQRVNWKLLVGTGFCGGLTTYSTFAVGIAQHLSGLDATPRPGYALFYAVATLCAGAFAAWAGIRLERTAETSEREAGGAR